MNIPKETNDRLIRKFYDMTEVGEYLFIELSEAINATEILYQCVTSSVYMKV